MTKDEVVDLLRETNQIYLGILYNGFLFGADTVKDVAVAAVKCAETRMEDAIVDGIVKGTERALVEMREGLGLDEDGPADEVA